MPAKPNVFNVAPGRPFLTALARAILAGDLPAPGGARPHPLDLPAMTILLPTRRAARALQAAFLDVGGGTAMLLPQIRAIAEGDEDQGLIESFAANSGREPAALELLPAIGPLERQLVLTELVMAWSARARRAGTDDGPAPFAAPGAGTPGQAARLAFELARLMDQVETEGVTLDKLDALVPENLSSHWQQTLQFLEVITRFWPAHLVERGLISPMHRRNRLIAAEAERIAAKPPPAPMIVAGVTGSVPATAALMRAVLAHDNGAIVLPALDLDLDADSWTGLGDAHYDHPQHGFHALLAQLGLTRDDVRELPGAGVSPAQRVRNSFISEALRPTGSMESWRRYVETTDRKALAAALDGMCLVEAASAEDEAEAIALMLREAVETPGRTAALVSPDRLLGRRVAIRLESWGIRVDDSAGRPFAKTMPGAFLDLVVEAWSSDFAPLPLMALLKHPLTRLGRDAGSIRRAARHLEIGAFRATYLGSGLDGVATAVDRASHESAGGERRGSAIRNLGDRNWAEVRDLVERLRHAFTPLLDLQDAGGTVSLRLLAGAHARVAEAIAAQAADSDTRATSDTPAAAVSEPPSEPRASPLWEGEAGETGWRLFESLADSDFPVPALTPRDYPDFYRTLVAAESVRSRIPVHPRLFIWGPFEARMQQTDVVILGSLNEGTWPKAADPGAWLNRQMRRTLGLPVPEQEVGRAAHDLTALLGARTVILTRADKVDGVPKVASRWLLRINALLEGLGLATALAPRTAWLAWARSRDTIARHKPVSVPEPRPPLALRPRRASVSDIETWIANPYAIFARHVLRLEALPLLGQEPGPQEKGQVIHAALSRFSERHARALPADIASAFLDAAREVVRDLEAMPRVRAFWLPRLQRFAQWFAATEPQRRDGQLQLCAETSARHMLDAPAGPFALTARADRIDVKADGAVIIDYKTGRLPTDSQVRAGLAPQLPLEAAMVMAGAFQHVAAMPVTGLCYIRATGAEPAGEERLVKLGGSDMKLLADGMLDNVAALVAGFDDAGVPFRAVRRAGFDYSFDDYAHLARVGEWSADAGEAGDG